MPLKFLIDQTKKVALLYRRANNKVQFLDNIASLDGYKAITETLKSINPKELGVESENDPYHFKHNLNKILIEADEDYKIVYFSMKKGTLMPMHDHPNKAVLWNMFYGKFSYIAYDKLIDKFRYN